LSYADLDEGWIEHTKPRRSSEDGVITRHLARRFPQVYNPQIMPIAKISSEGKARHKCVLTKSLCNRRNLWIVFLTTSNNPTRHSTAKNDTMRHRMKNKGKAGKLFKCQ